MCRVKGGVNMKSSDCEKFECYSNVNGQCNVFGGECMKGNNSECFNYGSCPSCRYENKCFVEEKS